MVDDDDLVAELVGLFEVLRREQQRRPLADELADDIPHPDPAARVETRRRLVEKQHLRLTDQAARQIEPALHAAGVGLRLPVGGIDEVEPLEQLRGPFARLRLRHVVEPAEHLEVLSAGQLVDQRGRLPRQPDDVADCAGVADHVVAEHLGATARRSQESREDAYCGRLAGAVGPEDTHDGAGRDDEVDAAQRVNIAEGLDQPLNDNGSLPHMGEATEVALSAGEVRRG